MTERAAFYWDESQITPLHAGRQVTLGWLLPQAARHLDVDVSDVVAALHRLPMNMGPWIDSAEGCTALMSMLAWAIGRPDAPAYCPPVN